MKLLKLINLTYPVYNYVFLVLFAIMYIVLAINITYYSLKPFITKNNKYKLIIICAIFDSLPLFSIIDFLFRPVSKIIRVLATIGYIYGIMLAYYILLFVIINLFRLLFKKKNATLVGHYLQRALSLIISIAFIIYGLIAAQNTKVTRLKLGHGENKIKIAFLSDLHYSSTGSLLNLDKLVRNINQEAPDILLLGGDIIDDRLSSIDKEKFKKAMRQINTHYGIYAILGNHEALRNDLKDLIAFYNETNVVLLADSTVKINNKLLIVGRLDAVYQRKELKEIIKGSSLPTIVLDHRPDDYVEAMNNQVGLMLAGHTHNGQLFPFNLIVKLHYLNKYHTSYINGLYQKDNFNSYISRGYGTWGFPMRTTGNSELVLIDYSF